MPGNPSALVLVLGACVLTSSAGCFAGSTQSAVTVSQQVDPDEDGDPGWLRLSLKRIQAPYPEGRDLDTRVNGPAGAVTTLVCQAPVLNASRCSDPLDPGERWSPGDRIYLPCAADGSNRFQLVFERGFVLEETHDCGETPFARR